MNPYLLLIAIVVAVAAFFGGQHQGRQLERAARETKQSAELVKANQAILALEEENRARERDAATFINKVSTDLEGKHAKQLAEKDRLIADQRAGLLRLRDPGTVQGACSGEPGTPAAGAGERDGAKGSELSEAFAEFLIGEADRADQIVLQLSACQATLVEDRKAINGDK